MFRHWDSVTVVIDMQHGAPRRIDFGTDYHGAIGVAVLKRILQQIAQRQRDQFPIA